MDLYEFKNLVVILLEDKKKVYLNLIEYMDLYLNCIFFENFMKKEIKNKFNCGFKFCIKLFLFL